LRKWLASYLEVLGEKLLIIQKEFLDIYLLFVRLAGVLLVSAVPNSRWSDFEKKQSIFGVDSETASFFYSAHHLDVRYKADESTAAEAPADYW
jgi:hypothetical protein